MKICPDCSREYDGEKCPECGFGIGSSTADRKIWKHLTTVSNDIEFNIVKGLLETAGIPAVRRVNGIDSMVEIVTGVPSAGVEILVPPDRYEEAGQLLNASIVENEEFQEEKSNE